MAAAAVESFLRSTHFIVVGASANREKFGNKVFRALQHEFGKDAVTPVNPKGETVEGTAAAKTIADALKDKDPATVSASLVVPPAVSASTVPALAAAGVKHIWLQPGAESAEVYTAAADAKVDIIAGGPCLLVRLGFSDDF